MRSSQVRLQASFEAKGKGYTLFAWTVIPGLSEVMRHYL
jgi:hypothetical protein